VAIVSKLIFFQRRKQFIRAKYEIAKPTSNSK